MNLSQEEIEKLMKGETIENSVGAEEVPGLSDADFETPSGLGLGEMVLDEDFDRDAWQLTDDEKDILGEVGNMCMGAVATTMYSLLDKRVDITTPQVSVHTTREVLSVYQVPFVIVEVEYIEGIEGKNLLLLKEPDAALITDLLMGGDGHVEEPIVLNELHMSAISEIMNQMIGSSASSLSHIIHRPVNISPPVSNRVDYDADVSEMLDYSSVVIKISFSMEIEGLLKSQLLQLMPFELGRYLAKTLMDAMMGGGDEEPAPAPAPAASEPAPAPPPPQQAPPPPPQAAAPPPQQQQPYYPDPSQQQPPPQQPYYPDPSQQPPGYPPPQQQPYYPPQQPYYPPPQQPYYPPQQPYYPQVEVRPMQFDAFDSPGSADIPAGPINMVYDIPLQVTVELGRTQKDISEILEFGTGSVIELDKIAGDPVEIMANGKLIARGEVVVIEENYGVRITEIINNR